MPVSPWLTFRQAREALRAGQPDEARRLLAPFAAEGYRKAIKLTRETARLYIARGEKHLRADNAEAAWRELLAAESLNTGATGAIQLRHTLTRLGLAQCRAALEAGNPIHVIETATRLRDRQAGNPELDVLTEAAQDWILAAEQADRGDFQLAKAAVSRIRDRLDPMTAAGPADFLTDLDRRYERFRESVGNLHEAADSRRWEDAVRWADEAVAAAPDHREARSLRAKAWDALQPEMAPIPLAIAADGYPQNADSGRAVTKTRLEESPVQWRLPTTVPYVPSEPDTPLPLPKRFLLWVDGVGGYLVCLGSRVTFGQATADGPVDVPLFADVSRLHAEVTRDTEGYVLESGREVQVNGTPAKRAALACGDRVTLGPTCQFVFRRPVPISPTAKLDLVSGHRLPVAVDGVLLMAESLVLGRDGRSHITLSDELPGNVVLYRSKDGLGVRFNGKFTVDGRPCENRSPLPLPAVVSSEVFTFAVEPVGARL